MVNVKITSYYKITSNYKDIFLTSFKQEFNCKIILIVNFTKTPDDKDNENHHHIDTEMIYIFVILRQNSKYCLCIIGIANFK